jgi:hypothetical protein
MSLFVDGESLERDFSKDSFLNLDISLSVFRYSEGLTLHSQ